MRLDFFLINIYELICTKTVIINSYLIVNYDMHDATRRIFWQISEVHCFVNDTLTSKSGVTMNQNSQGSFTL